MRGEYIKAKALADEAAKALSEKFSPTQKDTLPLLINRLVFVARTKRGLTQEKLAIKVGTKQASIGRLESSKGLPTLSFLLRVAEALDQEIILYFKPRDEKVMDKRYL